MALITGEEETALPLASDGECEALVVRRLPARQVAEYALNVEDGRFWRQLNRALWQKRGGVRRDENNHRPALQSTIVLKRSDFAYLMSLLETTCFAAIHDMLLDVLNVPNQADDDNAICEICQSVSALIIKTSLPISQIFRTQAMLTIRLCFARAASLPFISTVSV